MNLHFFFFAGKKYKNNELMKQNGSLNRLTVVEFSLVLLIYNYY